MTEKNINVALAQFRDVVSSDVGEWPITRYREVGVSPVDDRERLKTSILKSMQSGQFGGELCSDFLVFNVSSEEYAGLKSVDPFLKSKERDVKPILDNHVPCDRISSANFRPDAWETVSPDQWSAFQRQQANQAYQKLVKTEKLAMSFPGFIAHKQRCFDLAQASSASADLSDDRSMRHG